MFVCEECRGAVDLSDPGVVYAVELRSELRFVGTEVLEGMGLFFHEHCFPHDSERYRVRLRPERLSDAA